MTCGGSLAQAVGAAGRRSLLALHRASLFGVVLFATITTLCLFAPWIVVDPNAINLEDRLQPPSLAHLFGTDSAGRDIFARVLHGGRIDLLIATCAATLSCIVGGLFGVALGYFKGKVSEVFMRLVDVIQAFPLLILALTLVTFLGGGIETFIYAIAFAKIPIFIRLVRSETLSVRESAYVEAATAVGNPTSRIVMRHVLPNVVTSALTQLTSSMGQAIMITGGLSFLGVGIQPPTAEWGLMIKDGSGVIAAGYWWPSMFPGLAIVMTVLALHSIGEGLIRGRRVR